MSYQIVSAVIESDRYKGPTKAVLIALCQHINNDRFKADGDTEVWAGYKQLQKLSGWSRSVVKREIDTLEKDGVLEVIEVGAGTNPNHYRLYLGLLDLKLDRAYVPPALRQQEGGVGESPVVGLERPYVGSEKPHLGVGGGAGETPKQRTCFEPIKTNNHKPGNVVHDVFSETQSAEPMFTPLEMKIRDWARKHKFWAKFTRTDKGFRTVLNNGVITEQYQKARKTTIRVPSPLTEDDPGTEPCSVHRFAYIRTCHECVENHMTVRER